MAESMQHKLDRVRKPRVHITYDVEVGDAIQMKEIPFVLGVLADLSGNPADPLPAMKDRKFIEIDRDNFNNVLKGMKPRVAFRVDDKLTKNGEQIPLELKFQSMDDFHPENVAKQVQPLNKLVEARRKLSELKGRLDGNDKLDDMLQSIIKNTEQLHKLGDAVGLKKEEKVTSEGETPVENQPEEEKT